MFDGSMSLSAGICPVSSTGLSDRSLSSLDIHSGPCKGSESSSHLLYIHFHCSHELMGDLQICCDTRRVITVLLGVV